MTVTHFHTGALCRRTPVTYQPTTVSASAGLPLRCGLVAAEAEGVAGWIKEHSDVLLRLGRSQRGSQGDRLGDCGIEVADLKVEVHHQKTYLIEQAIDARHDKHRTIDK
jgi:hypothetical protein